MKPVCVNCGEQRVDMHQTVRAAEKAHAAGQPVRPHLERIAVIKRKISEHADCPEKTA